MNWQYRFHSKPDSVSIDLRLTESFSGTVICPQHQTATQRRSQQKVINKTKNRGEEKNRAETMLVSVWEGWKECRLWPQ